LQASAASLASCCNVANAQSGYVDRYWAVSDTLSSRQRLTAGTVVSFLPGDVGQHEVNLAGQLRVGNGDGWGLCNDCEVASAPLLNISGQDELEVRVGVVDLEPVQQ